MSITTSPDADLSDLASRLTGRVLLAGTDEYAAAATPWNVAVAPTFVAAVEVATPAEVATVVQYAAHAGLGVAVQATGHGAYAIDRPALLVLTHRLDEVTIDPEARTARVGAGVRWAAVIEAAAAHGLAGLAGSSPGVGVVGYVTGGGFGPVSRTFGWASDHVTAFDVVTGDGEMRRATPTENPDLFWGLRGGKGALGIVTAVEMDLVPLTEMYAGCLYFDGADVPTVLRAWAEWSPALPVEGNTSVAIMRMPDLPELPPPLAGRTTIAVRYAWVGDPADGERAASPIAGVAPVIMGQLGVMPYAAIGSIHADPQDPMPSYEGAGLLHGLPPEAVETLLELAGPDADCPQVIVELRLLGGAFDSEPRDPSAMGRRSGAFNLSTIGLGVPPVVDQVEAHSQALQTAMQPWSTNGVLPNYVPTADPHELARRYDESTFSRLGSVSERYDPQGVLIAGAPYRLV